MENLTACEYLKMQVDRENAAEGNLEDGFDCPICKNKGYVVFEEKGYIVSRHCECHKKRINIQRLKRGGLAKLINKYTFENYEAKENWQNSIKKIAQQYAKDPQGWFYFGGQPGCGKTHICTAICAELIKATPILYTVWVQKSNELKANKMDVKVYNELMGELQRVELLYIDDFLKTINGAPPTNADLMIAFEIINYRYNNDLPTIITSEYRAEQVVELDNALGGRIYEKIGNNRIGIKMDSQKNYRMKPKGLNF